MGFYIFLKIHLEHSGIPGLSDGFSSGGKHSLSAVASQTFLVTLASSAQFLLFLTLSPPPSTLFLAVEAPPV